MNCINSKNGVNAGNNFLLAFVSTTTTTPWHVTSRAFYFLVPRWDGNFVCYRRCKETCNIWPATALIPGWIKQRLSSAIVSHFRHCLLLCPNRTSNISSCSAKSPCGVYDNHWGKASWLVFSSASKLLKFMASPYLRSQLEFCYNEHLGKQGKERTKSCWTIVLNKQLYCATRAAYKQCHHGCYRSTITCIKSAPECTACLLL